MDITWLMRAWFGSLKKYNEKSYWKKNKYFYIYTRDGKQEKI